MLADDTALTAHRVDLHELSTPPNCVASLSTNNVGSAPQADPIADEMKNTTKSLLSELRVLLERLLRKHSSVFAASPTDQGLTSLMYHRIDI